MVHFPNIFVFQSLLKDEASLKIQLFLQSRGQRTTITSSYNWFPLLFPEPALTIPFPVNKLPNKLAPSVPNNILKNPPFCSFVSFSIVLVTSFNKILESSRACTIFIISFNSSFEIINVVFPDPNIFVCIPASAADAAAVNPKGIKTLLANGLITFFINCNPAFNNGPSNLLKSPPD